MQRYLFEGIQRALAELRSDKNCVDWIVEFMSHINTLMLESPDQKHKIAFYCDILFISVICLSGIDRLLLKKELLSVSQDLRIRLFPQAILMLVDKQIWKSITRQVFLLFFYFMSFVQLKMLLQLNLHTSYKDSYTYALLTTKDVIHVIKLKLRRAFFSVAKRTIHINIDVSTDF